MKWGLLFTWLFVLFPTFAEANDNLNACQELGIREFSSTPGFKKLKLNDDNLLYVDKFVGKVGSQFVSTVVHGQAELELESGTSKVRFICLDAGFNKGPVFFYIMPGE